jgi:hypothetical protein
MARFHAATAEPVSTAIDDAMNLHWTPRPGEPPLVGRVGGTRVTVWRRGHSGWVGLNGFSGEVHALETGAAVDGIASLRWLGHASNAFAGVIVVVSLVIAATSGRGTDLVGAALFSALICASAFTIERRDRRRLMNVVGRVVSTSPTIT